MFISFDSLWANLASTSFFTAFVPLALGGITYFNPWLIDEKEIRERSDLRKQVLLEKANKRLQSLMTQLDFAEFDLADLRGAPPGKPDFIADFTEELSDALNDIQKLARIYVCIRRCRNAFLLSAIVSLIAVLVALLFESARPYVSVSGILLIVANLGLIILVRRWATLFDQCEGRP